MKTAVFYHPAFLEHDTGTGHPESRHRLEAVLENDKDLKHFSQADIIDAPRLDEDYVKNVHEPVYVAQLKAFCESGGGYIDMDTVASTGSWEAALRAAGAAKAAVEYAYQAKGPAFCLVRPPGHHALPGQAMGFCLLNNAAIAAAAAKELGLTRILVFDWDAHHGNGDQAFFEADPQVLYVSMHQMPLFPGTGQIRETGIGAGTGYTINIPVTVGTGDDGFALVLDRIVMPVATQFKPELVILEAGFDSHYMDPLANLRLSPSAYSRAAKALSKVARYPAIALLEGGYSIKALPVCVEATIVGLEGEEFAPPEPLGEYRSADGSEIMPIIDKVKEQIEREGIFEV